MMQLNLQNQPLFKKGEDGKSFQRLLLKIENCPAGRIELFAKLADYTYKTKMQLKEHLVSHYFFLPEIRKAQSCTITLKSNGALIGKQTFMLNPLKKWRVHIIHFSHTDTGYTDLPSRIIRNHGRFLKKVLDYCRVTDAYPHDARFRWNIETGYQFKNGWERLSPDQQQELLRRIKQGRIELTPIFLGHNSELYDHELLARSVLWVSEFCRKYNIPLKSAMNTDLTGQPWAMVQILSGIGVSYLTMAVNETRGWAPAVPRPFYWEARNGSRVLVWNSDPNNAYIEGATMGLCGDYEMALNKLPRYLLRFENDQCPWNSISMRTACGAADNAAPVKKIADLIKEWNEKWEFPHLIFSTNARFMEELEKEGRGQFPVYKLSWPDYWVDLFGAVTRETGIVRIAQSELNSAEKMTALIAVTNKKFSYPKQEIDDAVYNLHLAGEHDWCAAQSVGLPDSLQSKGQFYEQAAFAYRAAIGTQEVSYLAKNGLAGCIKTKSGSAVVFNSLSWERSDLVELKIPKKYIANQFPLIFDDNEIPLAYQEIEAEASARRFIFTAKKVPPLGYRVFRIDLSDKPPDFTPRVLSGKNFLENRFYRVELNTNGTVASIVDKETGRELVNKNVDDDFYQIIYEKTMGGRPPVSMDALWDDSRPRNIDLDFMKFSKEISPPLFPDCHTRFTRSTVQKCKRLPVKAQSVFSELKTRSSLAAITRLDRSVILYDDLKRIDFKMNLDKREVREAEAVYLAFPFLLEHFRIEIENAYSFFQPELEQLPASCRDWYLIQKWLRIFNTQFQVFWSAKQAPLVQLGAIQSGKWLNTLAIKQPSVFSWLFNNYWWTNIPASQGGWNYQFDYSLSSAAGDRRLDAVRFGWNFHQPLQSRFISDDQEDGPLPEDFFSFCTVKDSNVIVTAIKLAEDGNGLIMRIFEVEGKETQTTLFWNGPALKKMYLTNPVEKNIRELKCAANEATLNVAPFALLTLRILTENC